MPDAFTSLLEWRRNEAAARSLAKLPGDYFSSTARYLADLKRSYETDLRANPSGRQGEISRQTYQRASQVARDILEGRMQKVLALSFQASIGGGRDLPNALPEEKAMFDDLLATFLAMRRDVAPYLEPPAGGAEPSAASGRASPAAPASSPPPAVRASVPASDPPRAPSAGLAYVRVLRDGRPVELGSETIDLRADDLVALPPDAAKRLVDAGIAELVQATPLRPAP